MAAGFASSPAGAVFAAFRVSGDTVLLQAASGLVVGLVAAVIPGWRSARIRIVDGLRHVG